MVKFLEGFCYGPSTCVLRNREANPQVPRSCSRAYSSGRNVRTTAFARLYAGPSRVMTARPCAFDSSIMNWSRSSFVVGRSARPVSRAVAPAAVRCASHFGNTKSLRIHANAEMKVQHTSRWRLDAPRSPPGGTDRASRTAGGDRTPHSCERLVPVDQLDRAPSDFARTLTELARPRRLPKQALAPGSAVS